MSTILLFSVSAFPPCFLMAEVLTSYTESLAHIKGLLNVYWRARWTKVLWLRQCWQGSQQKGTKQSGCFPGGACFLEDVFLGEPWRIMFDGHKRGRECLLGTSEWIGAEERIRRRWWLAVTASLLPRAVSRTEGRYGFLRVIYNTKVVPTGSGYDLCVPGVWEVSRGPAENTDDEQA